MPWHVGDIMWHAVPMAHEPMFSNADIAQNDG